MLKQKGFTLIELMIVIAIVAILAAIAGPAYKEQVNKGKRADGKGYLLKVAAQQERFYTEKISYSDDLVNDLKMTAASSEGNYTVAIEEVPDGCAPDGDTKCLGFDLTATPTFGDEKCPQLTYSHLGEKGVADASTDAEIDYCWR